MQTIIIRLSALNVIKTCMQIPVSSCSILELITTGLISNLKPITSVNYLLDLQSKNKDLLYNYKPWTVLQSIIYHKNLNFAYKKFLLFFLHLLDLIFQARCCEASYTILKAR